MGKKISLWISTLLYPITKSSDPATEASAADDVLSDPVAWSTSDQDADTPVTTSLDVEGKHDRKGSLGCGAVVRERLIKDLE